MGAYGSPELYPNKNNETPEYDKMMIYCQKCGTRFSKRFKRCPQCSQKHVQPFYNRWWFWACMVILFMMLLSPDNNNTTAPVNQVPQNNVDQTDFTEYITLEEFNQVRNGMTYRQVTGAIGSDGVLSSSYNSNGYDFAIYSWEGYGDMGANANITFENGKVTGKAQFGLK